jgi:hypothetical protein
MLIPLGFKCLKGKLLSAVPKAIGILLLRMSPIAERMFRAFNALERKHSTYLCVDSLPAYPSISLATLLSFNG